MKTIHRFMATFWMVVGMLALSMDMWMVLPEITYTSPEPKEHASYSEREYMRPEWLNDHFQKYYNEIDFFIIEDADPDGSPCWITSRNEIYINVVRDHRSENLKVGKWCMAHEVGHYVDNRSGYPSGTSEFQEAVDIAANMDGGIAYFPCLYDNFCDGWGGYGELYADLFQRQSIADIPAVLWDWYLPYYR